MEKVSFRCIHCGEERKVNILPLKHAVRTSRRQLNKKADCCNRPRYVDENGYCEMPRKEASPGILSRI